MTAQSPDSLIYDGCTFMMFAEPLEAYFEQSGNRPDFVLLNRGTRCSACRRGYTAGWEVVGEKLFLTEIDGVMEGDNDVSLQAVFPNSGDRIFANWFTGTILIPRGDELKYVHMGYLSIYEREILMHFTSGILEDTEMRENARAD